MHVCSWTYLYISSILNSNRINIQIQTGTQYLRITTENTKSIEGQNTGCCPLTSDLDKSQQFVTHSPAFSGFDTKIPLSLSSNIGERLGSQHWPFTVVGSHNSGLGEVNAHLGIAQAKIRKGETGVHTTAMSAKMQHIELLFNSPLSPQRAVLHRLAGMGFAALSWSCH